MKITKQQFENTELSELGKDEQVDELHEPGGEEFGGDTPEFSPTSQITVSTQKTHTDKSKYKPGKGNGPQTLDKYIAQTRNERQPYGPYGRYSMGNYYGASANESHIKEMGNDKMKEMIKELLKSKSNDREIVSQSNSNDLNNNNIIDINEIGIPDVISKTNEFIQTLNNNKDNFEDNTLEIILQHIKNELK